MLSIDSKFIANKSGNMNFTLAFKLLAKEENVNTKNVVAHLKGTDPTLAGQYIALGAHYDHVGANGDQIFNGADDDGSGTATVLDVAEAFSLKKSKRSIMIIFHTGEEKGLLGSEYYSISPIIPMDSIVIMLNLDMVGRSNDGSDSTSLTARLTGPNEIYMIGSDKISSQLHAISDSSNTRFVKMDINMSMNDESHPDRIYYRSDHWNYAKNQVPIIFYFDGIHKDYHKDTDTVEKIDFTKMAKVGRLAYITGYHVANRKERIIKDKVQVVN
jgi:Zn-dependent M28 family amino/carboxypeptidase